MRIVLRFSLLAFLLAILTSTNSMAQNYEEKAQHQIDSIHTILSKMSKEEQKIQAQVRDLIQDYEKALAAGKSKTEAARSIKKSSFITDDMDRIYVNILLWPATGSGEASVRSVIEANGGIVHSSGSNTITCWVSFDAIKIIAALPSVTMIEQFHSAKTRVKTSIEF